MTKTVRRWLKERPETTIVSISQNDWGNWCECPECRALDEREGSHAGSVLAFVNQVAEAIEKDCPDVAIETLAYQYTQKAPRTIKAHDSLIVRLCDTTSNFTKPIHKAQKLNLYMKLISDYWRILM